MPGKKVRVELIVQVSYSIHLVVIVDPKYTQKYVFGVMTASVLVIVNEQIYQCKIVRTLTMDYLISRLCHNMFIPKFVYHDHEFKFVTFAHLECHMHLGLTKL